MNDQIKYPDAPVFTVNVKIILLEWSDFDKFQRGYTGSNCHGLYLSNTEKNEFLIVVPKPKTPYVMGWSETERLLGHEIRHVIMEQNPGIEHPDPDTGLDWVSLNKGEVYNKWGRAVRIAKAVVEGNL